MTSLKNDVSPLNWRVPIVNADGTPTNEFMRAWQAQAGVNGQIPQLSTAAEVSAVLDVFGTARGSLLERGSAQWGAVGPGADGRVLRARGAGADLSWDTISTVLDTISSSRSAVLFRGAAGWQALAPGAATTVLTSSGAAADPIWAAGGGGGSGNIPASIVDDGTIKLAITDPDGFIVTNPDGSPILATEVFPLTAIPTIPAANTSGFAAVATSGSATDLTTGTLPAVRLPKLYPAGAGGTAAAGNIGQLIKATRPVGSAIGVTAATVTNVASIALGAGDFDASANISFDFTGSVSVTRIIIILNASASGINVNGDLGRCDYFFPPGVVFSATLSLFVGALEFQGTGAQSVNANVYVDFTGAGSIVAYGTVRARRMS
jgi:hypothetical protein